MVELFSGDYFLNFFMRYLHVLVGIAWIGLLYYFNLVQVPALASYGDEAKARNITLDKLARRALWWFRWAAIATLGTGILITGQPSYYNSFLNWPDGNSLNAKNASITVGMIFAITMAANVWMIIWKNQKVVLANAVNVLDGGQPDPNAAAAGRRALLASRQNMIFSVSMLWFMVGTAHFYGESFNNATSSAAINYVIIALVIGAVLQLNALGKLGGTAATNKLLWPYESHKNALITSGVLWLVLWLLSEFMFA
ncbi:MAG: antitermination protein NusG [Acidimicrobiia bacterium]|nr:antitermination protein NusG [Acidimicrobiia bacterium]